MRLLHTTPSDNGDFMVETFVDENIPQYAILSHTWEDEEVTIQDMQSGHALGKKGFEKVKNCCSLARANNFHYIWIDTCCIDKTSSAELSEAINSMYRWYGESEICYTYLADVSSKDQIPRSKWFTRGWTLQELIAPSEILFLDSNWDILGTKGSLCHEISTCTVIPSSIILGTTNLEEVSVAQRMSWASKRRTSRLEDRAYCLLGLFGINMPLIYGEGHKAFIRLQEEIMKSIDDHSIFVWKSRVQNHRGLLATSPDAFRDSADVIKGRDPTILSDAPLSISSKGIHLELPFLAVGPHGLGLAILHCTERGKEGLSIALSMRDVSLTMKDFERVFCGRFDLVDLGKFRPGQYPFTHMRIRQTRLITKRHTPIGFGEDTNTTTEIAFSRGSDRGLLDGVSPNVRNDLVEPLSNIFTTQTIGPTNMLLSLVRAGKEGNVEDLKSILSKHNITRDYGDERGRTPLSWAAEGGYREVVLLLLTQRNVDADSRDVLGRTPLFYAAKDGHEDIVWLLLARSDVEAHFPDKGGRTPLSLAAAEGHERVVDMILARPYTQLHLNDANGRTPLSHACQGGHEAVVKRVLTRGDMDPNTKDQSTPAPLWWATRNNHTEIALMLLEHGVDSNPRSLEEGQLENKLTPLWWALKNGNQLVVEMLLSHGAHTEARNEINHTPLSWATWNGRDTIAQLLLTSGAIVDAKDAHGRTPLSIAVEKESLQLAELLLKRKASPKARDLSNQTMLCSAVKNRNYALAALLLKHGANVNELNPLRLAVDMGDYNLVRLLLDHGAQNEAKSLYGRTRLKLGTHKGDDAIAKLLLEHGGTKNT